MEEKNINQHGEKSTYIEKNEGIININQEDTLSKEEIITNFTDASYDLRSYKNTFGEKEIAIPRIETKKLFTWIKEDLGENKSNIAVLVGGAGTGKSVILNNLLYEISKANIPVLGIKSDSISFSNPEELNNELQLPNNIDTLFKTISATKSVLIIDQIDALSLSLSTDRSSLNTLRRLIDKLSNNRDLRIVISCREYDLSNDPYLEYYKKKEVFRVSLLPIDDVKEVLLGNGFIKTYPNRFLEFLRTPIHLEIFCRIAELESSNEYHNLQELYEDFWTKFVIRKPSISELDKDKLIEFLEKISFGMYNEQQIFVKDILLKDEFLQEIEYLRSEEIISVNNHKIQFIHQSFFDYVYARSFVKKDESLAQSIKDDHQGLFVRPKIRQILIFLRGLLPDKYLSELKLILFEDFRFHIKHMILCDLGNIEEPNTKEKEIIKEIFENSELLFKIFLESAATVNWFNFLVQNLNIHERLSEENQDYYNALSLLCRKVLNKDTKAVLDFFDNLAELSYYGNFVSWTTLAIEKENANKLISFFERTKKDWTDYSYYRFLEKLVVTKPDYVINELRDTLLKYKRDTSAYHKHIPGGNEANMIYEELYNNHPDIAVPFFIEVIKHIVKLPEERKHYEEDNLLITDLPFLFYVPEKSGYEYLHQKIYNFVLEYLRNLIAEGHFEKAKEDIIPLLKSKYQTILNIPITFLIENPEKFKDEVFDVLSKDNLLTNYGRYHKFLTYNIEELLKDGYPLLNLKQKEKINELIINAIPEHERTAKSAYKVKGVTKWGYTRHGLTRYQLVSLLSEDERSNDLRLKKIYQEGVRKFDIIKREKPKGIQARRVGPPHSQNIYGKMTSVEWKNLMKKYIKEERKIDNLYSLTEIFRAFELEVSKQPDSFSGFIKEIIFDDYIIDMYIVYGLQGLKNANYNPEKTKEIFIEFITHRHNRISREGMQYLVWLTDYFIDRRVVDFKIMNFLCDIAKKYPDKEMLNPDDPVTDGINSVRGAAVDRIVKCSVFKEKFKEEIFSTLEYLAEKSKNENGVTVSTRASALFRMALLNNLDRERNLQLFLSLSHDFEPKLLSLPLHDLHPLVYLIHVDFQKLHDFFRKAIMVTESHSVMSHILFFAYLQDYKTSNELLNDILDLSNEAKKKVVEVAFEQIKSPKFIDKCLEIIERFIVIDNEELGAVYEHGFINLTEDDYDGLEGFINKYVESEVGKYRGYYFYNFLLKITRLYPEKCLEWTSLFKGHLKPDITKRMLEREPIKVVLQAYNGLKKYKDKTDDNLEFAMDIFDKMLSETEYRGRAMEVINTMDL